MKTVARQKIRKVTKKIKPKEIKHFFWHHTLGRIILILLAAILITATSLIVWFEAKHSGEPTELGVSFSKKYADELGINWQDAFDATIDDLGFKYLRLMSYWDVHEPVDNQFDFSTLDWQMDEAARKGVKVNLAIGERQPRWPECHHPDWVTSLSVEDFNQQLYDYITVVVNRYKNNPALEQYQLENEIFNNLFGDCKPVKRERVKTEYDIIKRLDPNHPVVINVSNQSGTPIRMPVGDKVGFSMYRKAYGEFGPLKWYFNFWMVPPYWHTLRAAIIEALHGAPTFVHELQTEPWGPGPTKDLSIIEQNKTMTATTIRQQVKFAERTGMSRIYMWGTEWWYWRLTKFNDPSLWNTVKNIVHTANSTGKY